MLADATDNAPPTVLIVLLSVPNLKSSWVTESFAALVDLLNELRDTAVLPAVAPTAFILASKASRAVCAFFISRMKLRAFSPIFTATVGVVMLLTSVFGGFRYSVISVGLD
jgi:hypothetical protein